MGRRALRRRVCHCGAVRYSDDRDSVRWGDDCPACLDPYARPGCSPVLLLYIVLFYAALAGIAFGIYELVT